MPRLRIVVTDPCFINPDPDSPGQMTCITASGQPCYVDTCGHCIREARPVTPAATNTTEAVGGGMWEFSRIDFSNTPAQQQMRAIQASEARRQLHRAIDRDYGTSVIREVRTAAAAQVNIPNPDPNLVTSIRVRPKPMLRRPGPPPAFLLAHAERARSQPAGLPSAATNRAQETNRWQPDDVAGGDALAAPHFLTPDDSPAYARLAEAEQYRRLGSQAALQAQDNSQTRQHYGQIAEWAIREADMSLAEGETEEGEHLLDGAVALINDLFGPDGVFEGITAGSAFLHGAVDQGIGRSTVPIEEFADYYQAGRLLGAELRVFADVAGAVSLVQAAAALGTGTGLALATGAALAPAAATVAAAAAVGATILAIQAAVDARALLDLPRPNANGSMLRNGGNWSTVPQEPIREGLVETFSGGRYTTVELTEDTVLFRVGNSNFAFGEFFTQRPAVSEFLARIDNAILPVWRDGTRSIVDTVYAIKFPRGTKLHIGRISTQGGLHVGGQQQIVIENARHLPGTQVVRQWRLPRRLP